MAKEKTFFQQVFKVVCAIPAGRITTYGAIAAYLGSPQAARMVGWALNASKLQVPIFPAHRVVNRQGLLTGKMHFGGAETMPELLESEGVQVIDNKIVDMGRYLWLPQDELPEPWLWLADEK